MAFKEGVAEIENRLKTYEEEEASLERQKFAQFKSYMSEKEKKQQQIKSLDDLSAMKAKEHLHAIESKIKTR